jgi:hypothetical protein
MNAIIRSQADHHFRSLFMSWTAAKKAGVSETWIAAKAK